MSSWGRHFHVEVSLGDDILMWQQHGVLLGLDTLDLEEAEWIDGSRQEAEKTLMIAETRSRVARSSYGQSATTVTREEKQ